MTLQTDLLAEFDADLAAGWDRFLDEYRLAVRTDPAMPEDTGRLSEGVDYFTRTNARRGSGSASLRSLARSDDGADYGTIIDRATGKTILPKKGRALGPFRTPVRTRSGSTRFLGAVQQSTKHRGWWAKVNSDRNLADALNVFGRFDL